MHEERGLDAGGRMGRRLRLAADVLGWGKARIAAFEAGYAEAGSDRARTWRHSPESGFDEADLSDGEIDSLGYREGAQARAAEGLARSDLPGADEAVLAEQAAHWEENGDADVADLSWRCEAEGSLDPFLSIMDRESWGRWIADEHAAAVKDGRAGYGDLLLQDIRDPVVYVETGDGIDVWDGYHRMAMAMLKGAGSLPVLVGSAPAPAPARGP